MFWIAQVAVVSFVMIFILHNLYFFFKEMLTVPKMKDMVKRPQQRYDALFRELRMRNEASNHDPETYTINNSSNNINNSSNSNNSNNSSNSSNSNNSNSNNIHNSNINNSNNSNNSNNNDNDEMKNELKRYLMELNGKHPIPTGSNLTELGSNFSSNFTGSAYQ
jgi:hypothetical protein